MNRILREPEVLRLTGLSRATIWRLEKEGKFPRRLKIANQAVGWSSKQLDKWFRLKMKPDSDQVAFKTGTNKQLSRDDVTEAGKPTYVQPKLFNE